jgi:hypothetical protein
MLASFKAALAAVNIIVHDNNAANAAAAAAETMACF